MIATITTINNDDDDDDVHDKKDDNTTTTQNFTAIIEHSKCGDVKFALRGVFFC